MRTAITLGFVRGKSGAELVFGPDTPINKQYDNINALVTDGTHEKYERVEVWENYSGHNRGKTARLSQPKPVSKKEK